MASNIETAKMFNPTTGVSYAVGSIVSRQLTMNNSGNITLFAFDKGQKLSEHTAPFDAVVQVIEGSAEIVINKEPHKIEAGEMIVMPANVPHAVNAIEQFKMLLTMIKG